MTALVVGTLLALLALAYVLHPLFAPAPEAPPSRAPRGPVLATEDPVAALREIEFDRATGKLSDEDYAALRRTYTERALARMRAEEAATRETEAVPAEELDPAEALVARLRAHAVACPDCGPRPEPDARWCSSCGRYLPGACAECGATVERVGARFCERCGHALAA